MMLSVAYIRPKSRTERHRKTRIDTEVAQVTRDLDTTFRIKGQGHQAALLTAVLRRQAAAAVSVGTYWLWEHTAMLRSARQREAGEGRGILCSHVHSLLLLIVNSLSRLNTRLIDAVISHASVKLYIDCWSVSATCRVDEPLWLWSLMTQMTAGIILTTSVLLIAITFLIGWRWYRFLPIECLQWFQLDKLGSCSWWCSFLYFVMCKHL